MTPHNRIRHAFDKGYCVKNGAMFYKDSPRKCLLDKQGYPYVSIMIESKRHRLHLHRLCSYQLYKEKMFEPGIVVRHLNDIKTDCSEENIAIGTNRDNAMDVPAEKRMSTSLKGTAKRRKYNPIEVKSYYAEHGCKKTKENFNIKNNGTLRYILKFATNIQDEKKEN